MSKTLVAAVVVAFGLVWSGDTAPASISDLVAQAGAVVGRPATPMSYAGVARRTTRRAYSAGAAGATTCVKSYNSYGQQITTCY